MSNTHSAFITGAVDGSRISVFIDGIPDKCEHDSLGGNYYVTESGRTITPLTFREWSSYTSEARDPLIFARQEAEADPIVGGGTTCSKCKKPFTPNFW